MTASNHIKAFADNYRALQAANANLTAENLQLRKWKEAADEVVREEYIRRDAFPWEEIEARRAVFAEHPAQFPIDLALMDRLLALREQEEGNE